MGVAFLPLLISLSFFLAFSYGSCLAYIEPPEGVDSLSFVSVLVQKGVDVRGDRTDYVLVVDTSDLSSYKSHVIFEDYNRAVKSYYVLERAGDITLSTDAAIFSEYIWASVKKTFIFAVPKEQEDSFANSIPSLYKAVLIPTNRLPAPANKIHARFSLPTEPDPVISEIISLVSPTVLKDFVTYLTGEASSIHTRQAQSPGAVEAQHHLSDTFEKFGFSVKSQFFRTGYSHNVVATLPGTLYPDQLVIVCSHYDDRGPVLSSTTNRAPGANDNGSGTGALLQIAKIIHDKKLTFAYTVVLTTFSGEEQGLYGSAYAAQQYYNENVDIVAVLNADMIAYRAPGANAQLDFTSRSTTPALTRLLTNVTNIYVPQLAVGSTTACCTDSASFYDYGYPSISFCEKNGYTVDPEYHKEHDLVHREGYDINEQYPYIVQAMLASLLTVAKYQ
eukprot:Phypoly_transcript_08076.p1 GENE.Phypoly_transcript_08076~~Phypoly_transcript_08076.p1  ORF type:complete len:446 (+),score=66.47 Phypoly_transcript_08076:169-1506(+)